MLPYFTKSHVKKKGRKKRKSCLAGFEAGLTGKKRGTDTRPLLKLEKGKKRGPSPTLK